MKRKGFTLVELLVVLVVIGILVALVLPQTLKAIHQANLRECASNLRSIDTAAQMCYAEKGDWEQCDDLAAELQEYFPNNNIPQCPFGIEYTLTGSAAEGYESDKAAHFSSWPDISTHN